VRRPLSGGGPDVGRSGSLDGIGSTGIGVAIGPDTRADGGAGAGGAGRGSRRLEWRIPRGNRASGAGGQNRHGDGRGADLYFSGRGGGTAFVWRHDGAL